MKKIFNVVTIAGLYLTFIYVSCSKDGTPAPPPDPCAGKTIVVTGTVTATTTPGAVNGSITASASGSTNFTYSLNGGAAQASGNFTGLAVGAYTITAKDAAGCTGSKSFTVTATPCPTITVTAVTTVASSPTNPDGSITATAAGSTGFTYSINNGAFQASGAFTGLVAGSYTVTAKDLNGCTGSAIFIVGSASCPTINITATTTAAAGPTATNGTITASATGGTSPYTYSKDGGTTFQATGSFTGLAAGNYTIIAKDVNNCLGTSATITVTSAPCPAITFSAAIVGCDKCINNTGSITITASGSAGFMYNLNGGIFQASNVFSLLSAASYTAGVRDANGCTVTNPVTVGTAPAGTQFTFVKAILAANCALAGCHAGAFPQNGLDFTDDCTIVNQSARIRARAVDANPSVMPPPPNSPLSASDKQKIVDWVNGGGRHSN